MAIGTALTRSGPQSSRVALNLQEIKPQLQSLLNDFFRSQQDEDSPTKAQRELQQAKRALAALESRQAEQRLVIDSLKAEKKGLQEEIQLQKEEATRLRSALQAALQTEPKALRLDTSTHVDSSELAPPPAYMLSFSQDIQFPISVSIPASSPTAEHRHSLDPSSDTLSDGKSPAPGIDSALPSLSLASGSSTDNHVMEALARHGVVMVYGEEPEGKLSMCRLCMDSLLSKAMSAFFDGPNLDFLETHCRDMHPEIFDS